MEMIEIDGKEISLIEFIEKNIQEVVEKRSKETSRVDGKKHENGFFYSEDDFQISLIRKIEKNYPIMKVFYEYPNPKNHREKIDIVLEKNSKQYPIELKYAYVVYGAGSEKDVIYGTNIDTIIGKLGEDINFIKKFLGEKSNTNVKAGYFVVLANKKDIKKLLEEWQKQVAFSLDKGTLSGTLKYKYDNKTKDGQITITNSCPGIHAEIENYQYLIIEISKDNFRDDK
ncbi:MAG: hypothetical protein WCY38_06390 [Endomicrobiia bacterium]